MDAADSEVHAVVEERAACSCPGAGKNYRAPPIRGRSCPFENSLNSSATRDADANAREWLRLLSQISEASTIATAVTRGELLNVWRR